MVEPTELEALRAENIAAWSGDIHSGKWMDRVNESTSRYLPVLEAEYDRLVAEVERLRAELEAARMSDSANQETEDV